ncbi:MAG: PASTA domain-containing protein [Spirochaetaceae bacterium]|jgi:beta-lactam-binding protein with PASTA domain|nr:PASTA domain-containing protein [Spirochaetaceae bacterium]
MEKQEDTNNTVRPSLETEGSDKLGYGIFNRVRLFGGLCATLFVFAAIITIAVFFVFARGAEEVMVPDVRSKELPAALIELQNKELYPRIQLRYSQSAAEKGLILEQDPKPGAIVKAGRRIRLVVSQGVLLSAVGSYIGKNLNDVENEFQSLFGGERQGGSELPLLSVQKPVLYQYSPEISGTILDQNPLSGTKISGPIKISFVVSKGLEAKELEVPALTGLKFDDALALITKADIRYEFFLSPANTSASIGTVVSQNPAAKTIIPADHIVQIGIASPNEHKSGEVYALFKHTLPENPYPLQTVLEVVLLSGERKTLSNIKFKGGVFTYPYHLPKGSVLVLSILNREIFREAVE